MVDDGSWIANAAFRICVSTDAWSRPNCLYTAHLVQRNSDMDIAVLRLDQTDIFWQQVDLASFPILEIDARGVPASQTQVTALGFPWIGSETITETQGVIAGTVTSNGFTYMKTDALIAGWNSGWPLLRNNKIIWVNTYGLGDGQTLWYALDISQATDFLETARQSNSGVYASPFASYFATLETMQSQKKLSDAFMSWSRDSEYLVNTYVPGQLLSLRLATLDRTLPDSVSLYFLPSQRVETQTDLEYSLEQQYIFDGEVQVLEAVSLGWKDFFEIQDKNDPSGWRYTNQKRYVGIIDWYTVYLLINVPLYDAEVYDKSFAALTSLLDSLSFSSVFPSASQTLKNISPWFTVRKLPGSQAYPRWSERSFMISDYEYLNISTQKHNPSLWDDRTTVYEAQTQDLAKSQHNTFIFQWKPWYRVCTEPWQKNTSSFALQTETPQWQVVDMTICQVFIWYEAQNNKSTERHDFRVTTTLYTRSSLAKKLAPVLPSLLRYLLTFPTDWETTLTTIMPQAAVLSFTDIQDQTTEFRQTLSYLISQNLLQEAERFAPYTAITREEYIQTYLSRVLKVEEKKRLTALTSELLTVLDLSWDEPVNQWMIDGVDTIIRMHMAWVKDYPRTSYEIAVYDLLWDEKIQQQVDTYLYTICDGTCTSRYDSPLWLWFFTSYKDVLYNKKIWLTEVELYTTTGLFTQTSYEILLDGLDTCLTSSTFDACKTQYQHLIENSLSYDVLTKGEMVNRLVEVMDFGE